MNIVTATPAPRRRRRNSLRSCRYPSSPHLRRVRIIPSDTIPAPYLAEDAVASELINPSRIPLLSLGIDDDTGAILDFIDRDSIATGIWLADAAAAI
jgi:hypothetical protein